jgi:hypothetical protein
MGGGVTTYPRRFASVARPNCKKFQKEKEQRDALAILDISKRRIRKRSKKTSLNDKTPGSVAGGLACVLSP